MVMAPDRLYVPAFRNTTCPLGQAAIALLICAAVAPGFSVAQKAVRFGMLPGIPAWLQSILRSTPIISLGDGLGCASESVERQSKMRENRSSVFRLITHMIEVDRCVINAPQLPTPPSRVP